MTKAELVATIAARTGISPSQVDAAVMGAFDLIAQQLAEGNAVTVHGFGTFCVRSSSGKRTREQGTGETIWNPSRRVPHFRPGQTLSARLEG